MFGISRWRHRHLLAAWVAYWAALAAITIGGAIRAVLAVTLPANGHGSFSASFGDKGVVLTVIDGASTVWTGTAPLSTIALWVAGPPLLLWGVWIWSRPRHVAAAAGFDGTRPGDPAELRAAEHSFDRSVRDDAVREPRERQ